MPLHDWTRVDAGVYHDFHNSWITHLKDSLNKGILPPEYYALSEGRAARKAGDVVALHANDPHVHHPLPLPAAGSTVAVAERPPAVARTVVINPTPRLRTRRLTIRHVSGDRIIAFVEMVSPSNKASRTALREFLEKAEQVIAAGVHLVIIDPLPPGNLDPQGIHAQIMADLAAEDYELPAAGLRTFVSYDAGHAPVAYLEHPAVGDEIRDLPLFLAPDHYVNLPLEATYQTAYRGMAERWRKVIEGK